MLFQQGKNGFWDCWINVHWVTMGDRGTILLYTSSVLFLFWGFFEIWREKTKMTRSKFIKYIFTDFSRASYVALSSAIAGFYKSHKPNLQFNFMRKTSVVAATKVNEGFLAGQAAGGATVSGGQQLSPEAVSALLKGKKKKLTKEEKQALKKAKKEAKAKTPYSLKLQDFKSKVLSLSVSLVPQVKGIKMKKKDKLAKDAKVKSKSGLKMSLFSKKAPKVETQQLKTGEAPKQEKVKKEGMGMFSKLKPKSVSLSSLSYDAFSQEKSKLKLEKERKEKEKKEEKAKKALLKAKNKNKKMKEFLDKIKSLTKKTPKAPKDSRASTASPSSATAQRPFASSTPNNKVVSPGSSSKGNPLKKDSKSSFGGLFGKKKEVKKS